MVNEFPITFPIHVDDALLMALSASNNHFKMERNRAGEFIVLSPISIRVSEFQGALRSAFLIKVGLSKEAFVETTVIISVCVDITRLSVYSTNMLNSDLLNNLDIVILAIVSAMLGAFIGKKLLKKVTVQLVYYSVAVFLLIFSVA